MFYFSSDIHFNNKATLITDMRPFKSTNTFDKYIIRTWNKQTNKNDTIFVIGDFVDCHGENDISWKKSILYVKKLKAKVVLITGNNEDRVIKYFFDNDFDKFKNYCIHSGFENVYKNLQLSFKDTNFYLVHKPIHFQEGMINLFGHTHRSSGIYKSFGFNIGCDINHFRLYSEDNIFHLISLKNKYWDVDKNVNIH